MRLFCKYFLVLVALVLCLQVQAQNANKHQIAAAELSGLFNAPSNPGATSTADAGVYYHLLSRLLEETGLDQDYDIVVLPMKRAKVDFSRKYFACYAPGLDTFDPIERESLPKDILSSSAFNHAIVKVLSQKNRAVVKALQDISKKDTISIVRGVPISPEMQQILDKASKFYLVNSEYENLKMLISGRVNHSLVFYPDVIAAYSQLGITEHFPYDKDFSPHTIRDNLICHQEHQSAFNKLEQAIQRYRQQGLLQKMLLDYYMPETLR